MKTQYYAATTVNGFLADDEDSLDWRAVRHACLGIQQSRITGCCRRRYSPNGFPSMFSSVAPHPPDQPNLARVIQVVGGGTENERLAGELGASGRLREGDRLDRLHGVAEPRMP